MKTTKNTHFLTIVKIYKLKNKNYENEKNDHNYTCIGVSFWYNIL